MPRAIEFPQAGWYSEMKSMLGKRVEVTFDWDRPVTKTGTLLWFDDFGEVCLLDDDTGEYGCGWPNLRTRLVTDAFP